MTIEQLILDLHAHHVQLWVEDGRLRYKAPQGAITPALREAMVAQKAALLAYAQQATAEREESPIQPVPRTDPVPLSFSQQRFWFFEELEGANAASNIPMAWRLEGPLDRVALEQSLAEIVCRHEILRTTFKTVGEQPVQVIQPPVRHLADSAIFSFVDLRASSGADFLIQKSSVPHPHKFGWDRTFLGNYITPALCLPIHSFSR